MRSRSRRASPSPRRRRRTGWRRPGGRYYASIFNPARLKVKAMQNEMPRKYWRNLPEASLIKPLIESAERTANAMIANAGDRTAQVAEAAGTGQGQRHAQRMANSLTTISKPCARKPPIAAPARSGRTPPRPCSARVRKPRGSCWSASSPATRKTSPASRSSVPPDRCSIARWKKPASIRSKVYVTNAVKHFKFVPRGKIRLHQKPNTPEIKACRQWYERELAAIKPDLVVAMGATAAQSVFGKITPSQQDPRPRDRPHGHQGAGDGASVLSVAIARRRGQGARIPALRRRPENRCCRAAKISTRGLKFSSSRREISCEIQREN